jgi:hypothetical protein
MSYDDWKTRALEDALPANPLDPAPDDFMCVNFNLRDEVSEVGFAGDYAYYQIGKSMTLGLNIVRSLAKVFFWNGCEWVFGTDRPELDRPRWEDRESPDVNF